jgi:hypothetical protein
MKLSKKVVPHVCCHNTVTSVHSLQIWENRPCGPVVRAPALQNGDVVCFLWGTNSIYICYAEESRPPLWSSGQRSWLQNGDVLCFLWGTNWMYICYVEKSRPPLWSSGQSSWLQNRDVLCFLWGTNWIYICYVEKSRPPLWSSGQRAWLQNGDVLCFLWGTNWIYICYNMLQHYSITCAASSTLLFFEIIWCCHETEAETWNNLIYYKSFLCLRF